MDEIDYNKLVLETPLILLLDRVLSVQVTQEEYYVARLEALWILIQLTYRDDGSARAVFLSD